MKIKYLRHLTYKEKCEFWFTALGDESSLSWILKITSWWGCVLEHTTYTISQKAKRKMISVVMIPFRVIPTMIRHLPQSPGSPSFRYLKVALPWGLSF